ncbi:MAG: DUF4383 domain-containing protein [Terracidiphilus sp.]
MKINLRKMTLFTKLAVAGLIGCAFAIWVQWLSGDPAYKTFPPGPVFFMVVAAVVAFGTRWWWTPLIGSLLGLLVTAGWFAMLPKEMLRLTHPGNLGGFAPGIFLGMLAQIVSLFLTDVAGFAATVENYRKKEQVAQSSKVVLRILGAVLVIMGVMVIVTKIHADRYHNLMHLTWGALAIGASFMTVKVTKLFCIASGLFYLSLGVLGLTIGNIAMDRAWQAGPMLLHTGDHFFHLVIGSIVLGFGLFSRRDQRYHEKLA